MLFSSRVAVKVRVRIRFSVWPASGYAQSLLLSVVIITLSDSLVTSVAVARYKYFFTDYT